MCFRKKIRSEEEQERPQRCGCCVFASELHDADQVLCRKRGAVDADFCCRRFRYDALKRVPRRLPAPEGLHPEDIIL